MKCVKIYLKKYNEFLGQGCFGVKRDLVSFQTLFEPPVNRKDLRALTLVGPTKGRRYYRMTPFSPFSRRL